MPATIVVVGSLNMDFLVSVAELPAAGQTVSGHSFRMLPGGKGANQANAAARLGGRVRMIGRTGYDLFGDQLKAGLSAAGVDVSGVHGSQAHPTGIAVITVAADGQNTIALSPGANQDLSARDVEAFRPVMAGAQFALFQLETPVDAVAAAMRLARSEGAVTILDPAPAGPLSAEIFADTDILTPNETEAQLLLGRKPGRVEISEALVIARALRGLGPRIVVLKMGDNGCVVADRNGTHHHPAFAVEPVDATAAGDTFNAALAVALAEGRLMPHAIQFANAAAAMSVTRPGAQASAPTRDEVQTFLEVHG